MIEAPRKTRVVIVGGGFGGLYAARKLDQEDIDLLVLDRTNYHLFQPLLYQVATATLPPTDITAPIRWLLRKQKNTTVLMANVDRIDPERRMVIANGGAHEYPYDYLIVAAGARHAYFNHPEWESIAPGLKSIDDAVELRQRILTAFEQAELTENAAERREWLNFVIVGGGPTGVELAGMLPTIAKDALSRDFRRIATDQARVILVEGGPKLLPSYPDALSMHARHDLEDMGVEVRTGTFVTDITRTSVCTGDETIPARTVLWAAGNAASSLGKSLGATIDKAGRVEVQPDLSVAGHPEIFAIGDMVTISSNGKAVPGVAPAAMQMGRHAANNIRRTLDRRIRLPFVYRNKGDLATIGRHRAIADFGRLRVTGTIAWWFWLLLHIMYLAGFRNRLSVLVEWAYSYFTFQRGARLIHSVRPASRESAANSPT